MNGLPLVPWFAAVCLLSAPALAQQPSDTTPVWANPAVWKSHSVSVQTDADILQHKLSVEADSAVCSNGAVHITARLFTDRNGHVRKYALLAGNHDGLTAVAYYYDQNGVLRKAVTTVEDVNGTTRVTNFYFDSTGKLIGKTNDLISGPGFPSPSDSAIRDPRANSRLLCGPPTDSGPR
jgi:hypothetical protein